jgi:uncharacterized protein YerC
MVKVYNWKSVYSMPDETKRKIESLGLSDVYFKRYADLGPNNKSAINRQIEFSKKILFNHLPLPPSPFIDLICNQTTGKSKQDFRMTMDGRPGAGKSTSCSYLGARYAVDTGERFGQDPQHFYNIDHCIMLQDTADLVDKLTQIPDHSAVVIDDAGVAAGSREFATISNRNLNKIYQTCRTKRWFSLFNVPVITHIDLQIRELVSAKSRVYFPCHDEGFNILKINTSEMSTTGKRNKEYIHRLAPDGKKIDFWTTFSPDLVDGYKGFMDVYDKLRSDAADDLLNSTAIVEKERKEGISKRDRTYQDELTKHGETVMQMLNENETYAAITRKTGLSPYKVDKIFRDMSGDGGIGNGITNGTV